MILLILSILMVPVSQLMPTPLLEQTVLGASGFLGVIWILSQHFDHPHTDP